MLVLNLARVLHVHVALAQQHPGRVPVAFCCDPSNVFCSVEENSCVYSFESVPACVPVLGLHAYLRTCTGTGTCTAPAQAPANSHRTVGLPTRVLLQCTVLNLLLKRVLYRYTHGYSCTAYSRTPTKFSTKLNYTEGSSKAKISA